MADFLVPILDFVPEKRPTAAQCLTHPWLDAGPRLREPSIASLPRPTDGGGVFGKREKDVREEALGIVTEDGVSEEKEKEEKEKDEREAMEAGVGNIAIGGPSTKSDKETPQPIPKLQKQS